MAKQPNTTTPHKIDLVAAMNEATQEQLDAIRATIVEMRASLESLIVLEKAIAIRLGQAEAPQRRGYKRKPKEATDATASDQQPAAAAPSSHSQQLLTDIFDWIQKNGPAKPTEIAAGLEQPGVGGILVGMAASKSDWFVKDGYGKYHIRTKS